MARKRSQRSTANAEKIPESPRRRENKIGGFDCNICFDLADNAVVTVCGHLFCRRCLLQWLHRSSAAMQCPVCRGKVAPSKIIKIHGAGDDELPPRHNINTTQEVIREFLQENMVGKRFVMPNYLRMESFIQSVPRQHRRQIVRIILLDSARRRNSSNNKTGDSFLQIGLDSLRRSLDS